MAAGGVAGTMTIVDSTVVLTTKPSASVSLKKMSERKTAAMKHRCALKYGRKYSKIQASIQAVTGNMG